MTIPDIEKKWWHFQFQITNLKKLNIWSLFSRQTAYWTDRVCARLQFLSQIDCDFSKLSHLYGLSSVFCCEKCVTNYENWIPDRVPTGHNVCPDSSQLMQHFLSLVKSIQHMCVYVYVVCLYPWGVVFSDRSNCKFAVEEEFTPEFCRIVAE